MTDHNRQLDWRDWATVFDALPSLQGQIVLDLGCGTGDWAVEVAARGASVIGIDLNEDLLRKASSRKIPNAEFREGDLRSLPDLGAVADGIWGSFVVAYFCDLPKILKVWSKNVRPGGWVALLEVDDLFGHEPLSAQTKALFRTYVDEALAAGRYDFHMGRNLQAHMEEAGLTVTKSMTLKDRELSFTGPARVDVTQSWRARFDRMQLLHDFCGPDFEQVVEEFLDCLQRPDHTSMAKVYFCLATVGGSQ